MAAAHVFGGLGLLVASPDTPPADIARARDAGMLVATLADAAERIIEALRGAERP
jgi:hypothetical protein